MTLKTPLKLPKMSTGDPSLTLNFFKMSTENPYLAQILSTDPSRPYP